MYIVPVHLDSNLREKVNVPVITYSYFDIHTFSCNVALLFPSSIFPFHKSCCTWGDLVHQDGHLGRQSEAMRAEVRVRLDLNDETERIIPLIRATALCWLPIHCDTVSGEEKVDRG